MKRIILTVIALSAVLFISACAHLTTEGAISEEIGVDISDGNIISGFDNHGGFHGDGCSFYIVEFEDGKMAERLSKNEQWKELPLDETVQTLVYGISDETGSKGPYVTDDNNNCLIPEIQNGYYTLTDRYLQYYPEEKDKSILDRAALNYTLGIYDSDTNILYFFREDT